MQNEYIHIYCRLLFPVARAFFLIRARARGSLRTRRGLARGEGRRGRVIGLQPPHEVLNSRQNVGIEYFSISPKKLTVLFVLIIEKKVSFLRNIVINYFVIKYRYKNTDKLIDE